MQAKFTQSATSSVMDTRAAKTKMRRSARLALWARISSVGVRRKTKCPTPGITAFRDPRDALIASVAITRASLNQVAEPVKCECGRWHVRTRSADIEFGPFGRFGQGPWRMLSDQGRSVEIQPRGGTGSTRYAGTREPKRTGTH